MSWRCRHIYPGWIDEKIKTLKDRLALYREREKEILDKNGVKSYTIGSRSLSRYDTSLGDIIDMIKKLEDEIAELEALKCGQKPRKAVGVIPRDW